MRANNSHIIQTQSIEIEFENLDDAIGVQNRIAELFYEKLQPKMEQLFDEMTGEKYFANIDKLEIDCGTLSKKNWEEDFVDASLRQLKQELIQINKKEINQRQLAAEIFLFFLQHGYLPWNSRIKSIEVLEEYIELNGDFISKLKKVISQSESVSERLAYQFTEIFCEKIISALTLNKKEQLQNIFSGTDNLKYFSIDKRKMNSILIRVFSADENKNAEQIFFKTLYHQVNDAAKPAVKKLLEELSTEDATPADDLKPETPYRKPETIYITNAGIIILHPFLPELFEQVKLTHEQAWIDTTTQQKAALLLEFLASGANTFPEFNLPLNKILCGIDLNDVLKSEEPLSDEIKTECENLLTEVIKHWSVLKNTSKDSLRETFLQRKGKLSRVDDGWLLQVEQKGVDILLSHLPWGIGTIKLPWMKNILHVEWT